MNLFDFSNNILNNDNKVSFENFNFLLEKVKNPLFHEYTGLNAYMLGINGFLDTPFELDDNSEIKNKSTPGDGSEEIDGLISKEIKDDNIDNIDNIDISPREPNSKEILEN